MDEVDEGDEGGVDEASVDEGGVGDGGGVAGVGVAGVRMDGGAAPAGTGRVRRRRRESTMRPHSGRPMAMAHGSSHPAIVSTILTDARKPFQPALSPARKPVSGSGGPLTAASGPSSTTVMVASATRPPSFSRRCLSESRSAWRRVSSDSSDVISAIVCARASRSRTRLTLASWVLTRALLP